MPMTPPIQHLACYRRTIQRIHDEWPGFIDRRAQRLHQQERHGAAAEKVAESTLEDLFTTVLDWSLGDLNNQVGHADLILTRLGLKYFIIEAKRPGDLAWNQNAVEVALAQARRYADEQKVKCIGVSDGVMIYAADIEHGSLHDRMFASLAATDPPEDLWWISVHGVYRSCKEPGHAAFRLLPGENPVTGPAEPGTIGDSYLHPKYKVPASCFGYVGDANDPSTWKLPFRLINGQVDLKRLPKAIQAIVSNYRGAKVSSIPERDIPTVLVRLADAAIEIGKMPSQGSAPSSTYQRLAEVLDQLGLSVERDASGSAPQSSPLAENQPAGAIRPLATPADPPQTQHLS